MGAACHWRGIGAVTGAALWLGLSVSLGACSEDASNDRDEAPKSSSTDEGDAGAAGTRGEFANAANPDGGGGGGASGAAGNGELAGDGGPGERERCDDGLDNDGDSRVDESCPCLRGETRACFGGAPEQAGVGICDWGEQSCQGTAELATRNACEGWVPPEEEQCNELDDDCDGSVDETCECATGDERDCYGGSGVTRDVGECRAGKQTCDNGQWGACEGDVRPTDDVCDGLDNDCDGEIDGQRRPCYRGPEDTEDVGICRGGTQLCVEGDWGACRDEVTPDAEVCNGLDDDCDGKVDGQQRACYTGPAGTLGVGPCVEGVETCSDGEYGECVDEVTPQLDECDGDGVDNDCDGAVDEDCACPEDVCLCPLGEVEQCFTHPDGSPGMGTPGEGICKWGVRTCVEVGDGTDWGPCEDAVFAESEICDDGLDNNCDGVEATDCVADCSIVDVVLLVDTTGSMGGSISAIQSSLSTVIVPGLSAAISDLQVGVASYRDFSGDVPFVLQQPLTANIPLAQAAVDSLAAGGGGDEPESGVEALYQAITGEGIGTYVPPASGCPAGTIGYMCFRPTATKVFLVVTDANTHNGPGDTWPYSGITPTPHSYAEAVAELNAQSAFVLGVSVGDVAVSWLTQVATDTNAVNGSGPIVFQTVAGSGVTDAVVDATASLCGMAPAL